MEKERIIIVGLIGVIIVLVGAILIVASMPQLDTVNEINNTTDPSNATDNITNATTSSSNNHNTNHNSNSNRNGNGNSLSNYQCAFCGKYGHTEDNCPSMRTPGGHVAGTGAEGWYVDENGNEYYWEP